MMKIYKMNDCAWVAAKDLDEAITWYKEYTEDNDYNDTPVECNIETETMWYGFYVDAERNPTQAIYDLYGLLCINPDKKYEIKYDKRGEFDFVAKLTFKEALELDDFDEPYIISTTEW